MIFHCIYSLFLLMRYLLSVCSSLLYRWHAFSLLLRIFCLCSRGLLFCNFLLLKFHTSDKLIHFTVGGNKRAECLKPGGCYLQVWEQRKQLGLSFKCCLWSFAIEKLSWRVWGVDGRVWRRGREGREMEKMQTCSLGSHGVPASFGVLCHPSLIIWGSSPKL